MLMLHLLLAAVPTAVRPADRPVATFSIAAADPATGEVGVAVASKFFAVGSVVPWAKAGVGAIATQSFANTEYGPRGLELLASGLTPDEVAKKLTDPDAARGRRQLGIVTAAGASATYTGSDCIAWAGGRAGKGYAVQGNILTGEDVVAAMERAFLDTKGDLAERLYAALVAGDAKGGDSRGRQAAALLVVREGGGYGGFNDRFIDVRVDDHEQPIVELGRLVKLGQVNGLWNLAWTAFTRKEFAAALPLMERTASVARASGNPTIAEIDYDLAVIRGAAGKKDEAIAALRDAVRANPSLVSSARKDSDLDSIRNHAGFAELVPAEAPPPPAPPK